MIETTVVTLTFTEDLDSNPPCIFPAILTVVANLPVPQPILIDMKSIVFWFFKLFVSSLRGHRAILLGGVYLSKWKGPYALKISRTSVRTAEGGFNVSDPKDRSSKISASVPSVQVTFRAPILLHITHVYCSTDCMD